MVDAHKNFAYSVIATAPIPATLGTTLTVTAGQGVLFPTPPFNATIYPSSAQPLSTNSEIVRVTAISIDTFTITRTQESTSARSIVVGDQIAATITAKTLTDVETAFVLKAGDAMTGALTIANGTQSSNTVVLDVNASALTYSVTSNVANLAAANVANLSSSHYAIMAVQV